MNFDITGFATYAAIVVICYVVGFCLKKVKKVNDSFIPIIVSALGGILGILSFYLVPDYPSTDIINALAIGLFSGLASTGINQVYKQINKLSEGDENDE